MAAPAAPLATAIATPSAPSVISDSLNEENPPSPPRTIAFLEISDVEVPLESLQHDLSAADSFHLDHLDDDVSIPPTFEPDTVPLSFLSPHRSISRNREVLRSPRSTTSASVVTSVDAHWWRDRLTPSSSLTNPRILPLTTPAQLWGLLHPLIASPGHPFSARLSRVPSTIPMIRPSFIPSGNVIIYNPGPGLEPQRHGLSSPCYYRSAIEERAPIVSPSDTPPIVDDDWNYLTRDFFPTGFRLDDLQSRTRAGPSTVPAFKLPIRNAPFGPRLLSSAGSRNPSSDCVLPPTHQHRLLVQL